MGNNLKIICFIGIYYRCFFNLSFINKYQKNNYMLQRRSMENQHEKKQVKIALHFSYFFIICYILLYLTVT